MLLFHYLVTSQMEPLLWFHITQNKIQHPCDGLQSPELSGPRPLLSSISHPPAPSSHTGLPAIPWTHQAHCHPRPFVLTAASALAPPPPIYLYNLLTHHLCQACAHMSPSHHSLLRLSHWKWQPSLPISSQPLFLFPAVLCSIPGSTTWHSMHFNYLCVYCLSPSIKI